MRIMLIGVAIEGGGAEQVIVDLARGLRTRGHDLMVVFLEGTDKVVPSLEAQGIRCERLLARRKFAAGPLADFTPSCIGRMRRLIRDFRPDVIHCHVPRPTLWTALALRGMPGRPPLVYTEHNIQEAYPPWGRMAYRVFLPLTEHVVAISQASGRSFMQYWHWAPERVSNIWNGIDVDRVQPQHTAAESRAALQTPPEARVVFSVGNLTSRKAQEVLVRAMAQVIPALPSARCWIAGNPELEPPTAAFVAREIAALGVAAQVQLLGVRRDVPDLLNAADLFVLSSRQEGFPITILEAMAAGKPVVATDVGGCAEAVRHGATGLIVPPEDPAALAAAITELLGNPDLAARMGAAGRQRVQANFTLTGMLDQHLVVYQQAIALRPRGRRRPPPGQVPGPDSANAP